MKKLNLLLLFFLLYLTGCRRCEFCDIKETIMITGQRPQTSTYHDEVCGEKLRSRDGHNEKEISEDGTVEIWREYNCTFR